MENCHPRGKNSNIPLHSHFFGMAKNSSRQATKQKRRLDELEQRIALVENFDKSMENTGKSLERAGEDVMRKCESFLHWVQEKSAVSRSQDASLFREGECGSCRRQDTIHALEEVVTSLGFAPLDPSPAHRSHLHSNSYPSSSKETAQGDTGFEEPESSQSTKTSTFLVCPEVSSFGEYSKVSGLKELPKVSSFELESSHGDSTAHKNKLPAMSSDITNIEAKLSHLQEALKSKAADGIDRRTSATDPLRSASNYWLQLMAILARGSKEGNPNDSVDSSELSFYDRSFNKRGLSAFVDAFDNQIEVQRVSLREHCELRCRLKDDIYFLDEVIGYLATENQKLITEMEQRHPKEQKLAVRKIKLLSSELHLLASGLQNHSTAARSALLTANSSIGDENGTAVNTPCRHTGMMAVQEKARNAILQECCNYLDSKVKDQEKARAELDKQERKIARAEALLARTEKVFHEMDPITNAERMMKDIKNMRMREKAFSLIEGKVDGRTFAEWLPDILLLVEHLS